MKQKVSIDYMISHVFRGFKPLCWCDKNLVLYKKNRIYISELNQKPQKICSIKRSPVYRLLSKNSLASRLLRLDPRAAIAIDDFQIIISLKGVILRIDIKRGEQHKEHSFRPNMNNPLVFGRIRCIDGFDDSIVYGEYWGNIRKEPVAVFGRKDDGSWNKLYEFPQGMVCHIHNIIPDPHTNSVLILTGDSDTESGIWRAKRNFTEIVPLLIGKQIYRSCNAYPTVNGIIYATDTPLEQNYIFLVKYKGNNPEKTEIEEIQKMDGPSIFSTIYEGKLVFSTSVESNPEVKLKGIKKYFDNSRGPGVKTNYSKLIIGDINSGFAEKMSFEKDCLPMIFQFGNISFPNNDDSMQGNDAKLVIYPQCVKNYGGDTLVLKLNQ